MLAYSGAVYSNVPTTRVGNDVVLASVNFVHPKSAIYNKTKDNNKVSEQNISHMVQNDDIGIAITLHGGSCL